MLVLESLLSFAATVSLHYFHSACFDGRTGTRTIVMSQSSVNMFDLSHLSLMTDVTNCLRNYTSPVGSSHAENALQSTQGQ